LEVQTFLNFNFKFKTTLLPVPESTSLL
jgi:hypothetical protein